MLAIATLHFTAMTAMNITPFALSETPLRPEDLRALALATALVYGFGGQLAIPPRQLRTRAFGMIVRTDVNVGDHVRAGQVVVVMEEMKMENEVRKIMHHAAFRASVTCVRVPIYRAHSVAVTAEFSKPVSVEAAREVFANAPGLDIVDNPEKSEYPLPLYVAERDNCQVGRIRKDCALDNGLAFWVAGFVLLILDLRSNVKWKDESWRRRPRKRSAQRCTHA